MMSESPGKRDHSDRIKHYNLSSKIGRLMLNVEEKQGWLRYLKPRLIVERFKEWELAGNKRGSIHKVFTHCPSTTPEKA